jgi:hypothetical protein
MDHTTKLVLLIGAAVVFLPLLLLGLPRLIYYLTRRPLERRVGARHAAGDILRVEYRANFFGVESRGMSQVRGLGALVLTHDTLHFHMLLPDREVEIPRATIRGTALVRWHLGKTSGHKLLKVHFDAAGGEDSVAWYVPAPEAWQAALETPGGGRA